MYMYDEKNWYQSKTIWGAIAVIISSISQMAGVSLDAGQLTEATMSLVSLVGGVVAYVGRVKATHLIK